MSEREELISKKITAQMDYFYYKKKAEYQEKVIEIIDKRLRQLRTKKK